MAPFAELTSLWRSARFRANDFEAPSDARRVGESHGWFREPWAVLAGDGCHARGARAEMSCPRFGDWWRRGLVASWGLAYGWAARVVKDVRDKGPS